MTTRWGPGPSRCPVRKPICFISQQTSPTEYRLYFNGGVVPDYETLQAYSVSVDVDDPAMGDGPDARFSLTITGRERGGALHHVIRHDHDR